MVTDILEIPGTFHQRQKGQTKRNLVTFAVVYAFTLARLFRLKLASLSLPFPWENRLLAAGCLELILTIPTE